MNIPDIIEINNKCFRVEYKIEKTLIWASTYVNGIRVEKHGNNYKTAYWALEQAVYQALNFRL